MDRKKQSLFLNIYIVGLFSVAIILILLSYLVKSNKEVENYEHIVSEQMSHNEQSRKYIENMNSKIDEGQKQIEEKDKLYNELLDEYTNYKQTQEALSIDTGKKMQSYELMWAIENAYNSKKYKDCREYISKIEEYYSYLTEDMQHRLDIIKDNIKNK